MALERSIESYAVRSVKKVHGLVLKLIPFACKGVPDRLIILPGPRVLFVEFKRPVGGRISEHQHKWRRMLERLGCEFHFANTREQVNEILGIGPDQ